MQTLTLSLSLSLSPIWLLSLQVILEQDELNTENRISAAVALGAPYDLYESSELMKAFPNRIYSSRMASGLVNILRPVAYNFEGVVKNFLGQENSFKFDPEKCFASKTILDFDEALTAPFFGFKVSSFLLLSHLLILIFSFFPSLFQVCARVLRLQLARKKIRREHSIGADAVHLCLR